MTTTSTSLLHRIVIIVTFLSLCMIKATVNANGNVLATGSLSASASASVEETTSNIATDIVTYLSQWKNSSSSSSNGQVRRTTVSVTATNRKRTKQMQMKARQMPTKITKARQLKTSKAPEQPKAQKQRKCPKSTGLCGDDNNGDDIYNDFDLGNCTSYSDYWLWDLALTCQDSENLTNCECTSAAYLMSVGRLSCPDGDDAPYCPSDCKVCETCLTLLGCPEIRP